MPAARTLIDLVVLGVPVAAIVALAASTPIRAETRSHACFQVVFDQPRQPIRRIMLDLDGKELMVEEWGLSRAPFFDAGMSCKEAGEGKWECSVECDGGRVSIAQRGDRSVELKADGLRLADKLDSLLSVAEPRAGTLDGSYTLVPAQSEKCQVAFGPDRPGQSALRAGDFSPRVERLEKALSNLGYFSQQPDWYFTAATADALRAFQRFVGLPQTGVSDAKTTAKLRLLSSLRAGC